MNMQIDLVSKGVGLDGPNRITLTAHCVPVGRVKRIKVQVCDVPKITWKGSWEKGKLLIPYSYTHPDSIIIIYLFKNYTGRRLKEWPIQEEEADCGWTGVIGNKR